MIRDGDRCWDCGVVGATMPIGRVGWQAGVAMCVWSGVGLENRRGGMNLFGVRGNFLDADCERGC